MKNAERIKENKIVNDYEAHAKKINLTSTPQYVTIGANYRCNAKCAFCLGGKYHTFSLPLYKNLFEKKMGPVLRNAEHVGFCGVGEVLLMPDIMQFLDHVNATLNDNIKNFTTNGIALTPKICEKLAEGRYAVMVSLHAADRKLHEQMTGTRSFDTVMENIKYLVKMRDTKNPTLHINLVFLLTTANIDNLPDFVKKAAAIGADRVTCSYYTIFETEKIPLSCYFEQQKTNRVFDKALAAAEKVSLPLILPPRFGRGNNPAGTRQCSDPWNFFYVETKGSVNPCCSAGTPRGNLTKESFEDIWNGPGYRSLRTGIVSGKTHAWCKHCFKYDPDNINAIRSHISLRPNIQKRILDHLRKHYREYSLSKKDLEL